MTMRFILFTIFVSSHVANIEREKQDTICDFNYNKKNEVVFIRLQFEIFSLITFTCIENVKKTKKNTLIFPLKHLMIVVEI